MGRSELVWRFTLAWFNETLNYVSNVYFRLCLQFAFVVFGSVRFFTVFFFSFFLRCVIKWLTHKHTNKPRKRRRRKKWTNFDELTNGTHEVSWIDQKNILEKKNVHTDKIVAIKVPPKNHMVLNASCQLMHVGLFTVCLRIVKGECSRSTLYRRRE